MKLTNDETEISSIPCNECGGLVREFSVPNNVWNAVMRPDGHEVEKEYLCWHCWNEHLEQYIRSVKGRLDETTRELLERREADRWIPVELGKIPKHQMLEACNIKTRVIDICMLGSISWKKINPTHYRAARPLPGPPEAQP